MKYTVLSLLLGVTLILSACSKPMENPFLTEWDTPFGVPPFDQITLAHYAPAFEKGMHVHNEEIEAIIGNSEAPTFENTIEALDEAGSLLNKVSNVFFAMNSSMTGDEMQAIARDIAPALSRHGDAIFLNPDLFERVKAIHDERTSLTLTEEQATVLDKYYKRFVRNGANLDEQGKERLKQINEELSLATLKFGENVLAETNKFELIIEKEEDLSGLPDGVIAGAAEAAADRGKDGKWVFTLHSPSIFPFLQYADNRDLRRQIFTAYMERGNHGDELDNNETIQRVIALRQERAGLLGYETHAHYVLEENMARMPEAVYQLLNDLWTPALARAGAEVADMQAIIDQEGGGFELEPWDWWYYAEKVKKVKYDLDEEMLRPYFELSKVRDGAFEVATRLYGIQFRELPDAPKYHEDVTVFEVVEANGDHVGVLFVDYFPRASKRGGAWMSNFREQSKRNGESIRPIIYNVGNFTKPAAGKPSLLSVDEVNTLFHEFGHALHGLLTDCTYESVSGTNVARDFVELGSQIMENWALDPEVLPNYARHYETGEPIPGELIDKITASNQFNQGFVTTEYLAASFLDMDWHTLAGVGQINVTDFENAAMNRIGLIPEIISRYRSTYFSHIFSGGYAAGYYSYIWAEVLDKDAFQAFKEAGNLFDPTTATAFREHILKRGGSADEMELYRRFRGKEPSIEPLLISRGLK